ncbi:MAG TPA: alpha/beta hydrolase [Steroidobacteraceae bacterium]|nr:alpha/beta hydrolase [Steroidobacteraceae bacterium]
MPEVRATIVLVHGAWHGSWCWEFLKPQLLARSLSVRAVQLPSASSAVPVGLSEDARHLSELLSTILGPVILCGHSYGGMVISAADTDRADVRQLVYLCAYMTEAGESLESSLRKAGERRPGHWIRHLPDGSTRVDAARAAQLFYDDCPDVTRTWALAQLRPHWGRCLSDCVASPAWHRHPSTYVACDRDQVLAPQIQRDTYARRAQQCLTLASGHSPFLSHPEQLAQALASIAP